ncbi:YhcH/YjgK/YiaL family protein [Hufsiella ginkgonis]|uniref:DUF386 family protein n=1 Tax=Hufsiella ginkgonis TaxID=2695274 RepID=A0A7K1XTF3_9SPHI|nr:YhcH/YjgK/YiaL family protein [Hufsiella ginkgonis]MXV14118.1 DUF386 family protein [Hufsiella ginkgonis]
MIIDSLENGSRYYSVHPLFAKAFEYLHAQDLDTIGVGKYDIAEGLKIGITDKEAMTVEESTAKFECHNQHIDIQVCIRGTEKMGWKPRGDCKDEKGSYNPEKDVAFYNDAPDMFFELNPGQFVIFFPEDVHAPMIGSGPIKKGVVKVRI